MTVARELCRTLCRRGAGALTLSTLDLWLASDSASFLGDSTDLRILECYDCCSLKAPLGCPALRQSHRLAVPRHALPASIGAAVNALILQGRQMMWSVAGNALLTTGRPRPTLCVITRQALWNTTLKSLDERGLARHALRRKSSLDEHAGLFVRGLHR